ncbi:MAG: ABC transporter ATP-binding protein [Dehalococcoidales bacterium]|nr:ABC transporter ATP-binding protein [Dehalococcoidales bacterium]
MMTILECNKVSKNFGGLAAVSNVDLKVGQGEIVGLIGPNGAGKTTLFNLISGAIPRKSGTIIFKGKTISGLKPFQINKMGIARTFQSAKVFIDMTVTTNVMLGALFGRKPGLSTAEAERITADCIGIVGLSEMSGAIANDLTMVNKKRLEVARALATRPELLMLDEVMAGLNPTEVSQAMDLIKRIRDSGVTVLMIEHVMKAIMNICDRIVVLHHGEKLAEGTPQEIASNSTVIEVYLGE